jgi:hypothetical protein
VWNKQKDDYMPRQQPEPINRDSAFQPASPASPAPVQTGMRVPAPAAPTASIGPSMFIKGEIRLREELLVEE